MGRTHCAKLIARLMKIYPLFLFFNPFMSEEIPFVSLTIENTSKSTKTTTSEPLKVSLQNFNVFLARLLAMDVLVLTTMKNAAKCDT